MMWYKKGEGGGGGKHNPNFEDQLDLSTGSKLVNSTLNKSQNSNVIDGNCLENRTLSF